LEEEIKAFEADIRRLDEHAALMTSASAVNGKAVSIGARSTDCNAEVNESVDCW